MFNKSHITFKGGIKNHENSVLRPNLVKSSDFKDYLSQIEKTNWYSNYGPLNTFLRNVL